MEPKHADAVPRARLEALPLGEGARRRVLGVIARWTLPAGSIAIVGAILTGSATFTSLGLAAVSTGVSSLALIRLRLHRVDWLVHGGAVAILVKQLMGNAVLHPVSAAVVVGVMGITLVRLMRLSSYWLLPVYGLFVAAIPILGGPGHIEIGLVLGASYASVVLLQVTVLRSLDTSEARRRHLSDAINQLAVPVFREDYTQVADAIRALRRRGVSDIEAYLERSLEEVRRIVGVIQVIDVNDAAASLFGLSRFDLIGGLRPNIVTARNQEAFIAMIMAVASGSLHVEVAFHGFGDEDNHYRVVWLAADDSYRSVMLAMHDVTDLHEKSELQRSLNEGKDRFIATIAHELRTPLTAVLGFAAELETSAADLDEGVVAEYVDLISSQGREISHIVEDLLVAERSAIDRVALRPIHLEVLPLLDSVCSELAMSAEVTCPETLQAWADEVRTRQIVRNLLTNACRYGGSDVRLDVRVIDEAVVIRVSDDGHGVEVDGDLFEPYSTGEHDRRPTGSTGLGLYVARGLARAMSGDLTYERDQDRSVFTFSLPTVAADASTGHSVSTQPSVTS